MTDIVKTVYRVTIDGTEIVARTAAGRGRPYTHAVVSNGKVRSMHSSRDLAAVASSYVANARVLPVTREEVARKRTAPKDKNAIERGVISRMIGRQQRWHDRYAADLARLQGENWLEHYTPWSRENNNAETLARWRANGIETALQMMTVAKERIAKLEEERAALLATPMEG